MWRCTSWIWDTSQRTPRRSRRRVDVHVGFPTQRPTDGYAWNRQLAGELGELMRDAGFGDFRVTSLGPLAFSGETATLLYLRRVADEGRFPKR